MKSFLSPIEKDRFTQLLTPPLALPEGEVFEDFVFTHHSAFLYLSQVVEEKLRQHPLFSQVEIIALGSLSRNELCPNSDVDLVFLGQEEDVKKITSDLMEQGWPLRYRMPQDLQDWSLGVEIFDILAILKARPLSPKAAQELIGQRRKIWDLRKKLRKEVLQTLLKERADREQRHSSMTNYLEPNLKFGPGGLRDLEQGLQILELYPEKFQSAHHARDVLKYCKIFFLAIRGKLHSLGQRDILSAQAQFEISEWLGFANQKDFMRVLQRSLSRVHFYSNWILEVAKSQKQISIPEPKTLTQALALFEKNPSILAQHVVRQAMDGFPEKKNLTPKKRAQVLARVLSVKGKSEVLSAVFDSRLIQQMIPDFSRLVGYVQHDQYHRYTADAHILRACQTVQRVYRKPNLLLHVKEMARDFSDSDWKILEWTALYHDMGKGFGLAEKHGQKSKDLFRQHVGQSLPKKMTEEIEWLVLHHLDLSQAAFRKNSQDRQIWQTYSHLTGSPERIRRLAVFTVIDIIATNPEAWGGWKAQLIRSTAERLCSREVTEYVELRKALKGLDPQDAESFTEKIDLSILKDVGIKNLSKDLKHCLRSKDSEFKTLKGRSGSLFLRYFNPKDQDGLLLQVLTSLYQLGISVKMASVMSFSDRVYDLFLLQTTMSGDKVEKLIRHSKPTSLQAPEIKIEKFELSSLRDGWSELHIEAMDQRGLFLSIVSELQGLKASIQKADIHTWGRRVEDLIIFHSNLSSDEIRKKLNEKWIGSSAL